MNYRITCPYCFCEMDDEEVAFRSEVVHQGVPDFLPDEYDDVEDFNSRYRGEDKAELLDRLRDWYFFAEGTDDRYEMFWKEYNGTTEYNPADAKFNVLAYRRKVIDPNNKAHQKYIKQQADGSYYLRDEQGMANRIVLTTGEECSRRVCKECHNPLPLNYGKNPIRFAAIVGITGSGKTVYLSQLLNKIKTYVSKVGQNTDRSGSVRTFVENNAIVAGAPLPASTPQMRLQQPLFFNLIKDEGNNKITTNTFVLYDVAGEVFTDEKLVDKFAPFVRYANGIITLIDPMQFESISSVSDKGQQLADATLVLEIIRSKITHGKDNEKCSTPIAICLAKADIPVVQQVFSEKLKTCLLEDVKGDPDKTEFNALQYAPVAEELSSFLKKNGTDLYSEMKKLYSNYAYFAFTALGCPVETEKDANGAEYQYPVGPVVPKRIEEPLLWLFYKLEYIGRNGDIPGEIVCPECGSPNSTELKGDDCYFTRREGFWGLRKQTYYANRECNNCGFKWDQKPED